MPPEASLEPAKQRLRHPPPVPVLYIAVLDVVGDAIGEDVIGEDIGDLEWAQKFFYPLSRICVRDWTPGLRLRMA